MQGPSWVGPAKQAPGAFRRTHEALPEGLGRAALDRKGVQGC